MWTITERHAGSQPLSTLYLTASIWQVSRVQSRVMFVSHNGGKGRAPEHSALGEHIGGKLAHTS